jgi:hypothetical protein
MTYKGRVKNGVVVLEGSRRPREGAIVRIEVESSQTPEPAAGKGTSVSVGREKRARAARNRRQGARSAGVDGHRKAKAPPVKKQRPPLTREQLARIASKNPPPPSWFAEPACDLTKPEHA